MRDVQHAQKFFPVFDGRADYRARHEIRNLTLLDTKIGIGSTIAAVLNRARQRRHANDSFADPEALCDPVRAFRLLGRHLFGVQIVEADPSDVDELLPSEDEKRAPLYLLVLHQGFQGVAQKCRLVRRAGWDFGDGVQGRQRIEKADDMAPKFTLVLFD